MSTQVARPRASIPRKPVLGLRRKPGRLALAAGPAARVRLGHESYVPQHRFLSGDEAFGVAVNFRREHPHRLRLISTILGWGDLRDDAKVREFITTHPFVAFRPVTGSPA